MMGLALIILAFALSTLKAPLRRSIATNQDADLPELLGSLWYASLNVIVCAATPISFWSGVILIAWRIIGHVL